LLKNHKTIIHRFHKIFPDDFILTCARIENGKALQIRKTLPFVFAILGAKLNGSAAAASSSRKYR